MKKIIIIFIVAFCLFFTGVFCFSAERTNYEKYVYLWRLKDGLLEEPANSVLTEPKSFDSVFLEYTKYQIFRRFRK